MTFRTAAFVAAALALGCSAAPVTAESTRAPASAPRDFELPALAGGSVRLSDELAKGPVLIDFWATYCEPCLLAMPDLDRLYKKYRERGFVVLGVSIDAAGASARVRSEVMKLGVSFPILLDQETRVIALYNPRASAPYSVLIGRDGAVLRRQEGYTSTDHEALEQSIVAALR